MRSWFIAALAALAIGMLLPSTVEAVPAGGQTSLGNATAGSSLREDARYVLRCHNVRVLRHNRHGRPYWTTVRRCHRRHY